MKLCGKHAPGAFNSICINMARGGLCLVVSFFIWLIADGETTTASGHAIAVFAGIGTVINLFTWILTSRFVSLVMIEATCTIGTLIVPLILAPILYEGDSVTPLQWIGSVLIFASLFLFARPAGGKREDAGALRKVGLLIACAAGAMITAILKKYYSFHIMAKGLGSIEYFTLIGFLTLFIFFGASFLISCVGKRRAGVPVSLPYRRIWVWVLVAAASLYVNELFTTYASQLPSSIYYPLSRALTIGCTFLVDLLVFRERVTWRGITGLVMLLAAVLLITIQ